MCKAWKPRGESNARALESVAGPALPPRDARAILTTTRNAVPAAHASDREAEGSGARLARFPERRAHLAIAMGRFGLSVADSAAE